MLIKTRSTDSQTFAFKFLALCILCGSFYTCVLGYDLISCSEENGGVLHKFTENSSHLEVDLGFAFQYSTESYTSVFIDPRGLLEFGQPNGGKSVHRCRLSTDLAVPTIAVLAPMEDKVAVDIASQAQICYHTIQDANDLKEIGADLSQAFPAKTLKLKHAFVVTWHGFLDSVANIAYQAVLTTDESSSFVIFNFGKLLTSDNELLRKYEFSGFVNNEGIISHFIHPSHEYYPLSAKVTNGSNLGQAGKWTFQVDPLNVVLPALPLTVCGNQSDFFLVSIYEYNLLIVHHPCLEHMLINSESLVNCTFEHDPVMGRLTNFGAVCEIPAVNSPRIVEAEIRIQAKHITLTHKYPVFVEPIFGDFRVERMGEQTVKLTLPFTTSVRLRFLQASVIQSFLVADQKEDLSWEETLLGHSGFENVCVQQYGFQKEFTISDILSILQNSSNPRFVFRREYRFKKGMSFTTKQISDQDFVGDIWKAMDGETLAKTAGEKCESWLKTERNTTKDVDGLKVLKDCLKTVSQAKLDFRFRSGPFPHKHSYVQAIPLYGTFYPRFATPDKDLVSCTYNKETGYLNIQPPSLSDERPRLNCCHWAINNTEMCQNFLQIKPSLSLSDSYYEPPQIASISGLGHVTPFESFESFQIYTKSTPVWLAKYQDNQTVQSFEMQGHFVRLQGTAFSVLQAVSLRLSTEQDNFTTIEFSPGSVTGKVAIKIQESNNTARELDCGAAGFEGIYKESYHLSQYFTYSVSKDIPKMIMFSLKFGFSIFITSFVEQDAKWLSVALQHSGGLGTGYLFQHMQICGKNLAGKLQSNEVPKNGSIFISDFDSKEINTPSQESSVTEFSRCNEIKECLFDYSVTRNRNIALNTKAFMDIFQHFQKYFYNLNVY